MKIRGTALLLLPMGSLAVTDDARAQHPEQLPGAADPPPSAQPHEVRVTDLTPRFPAFYDAARAEEADEARRWELWKQHYDFVSRSTAARRALRSSVAIAISAHDETPPLRRRPHHACLARSE